MPCGDGGVPYRTTSSSRKDDQSKVKMRLDEVTQNLCYMCGEAENLGFASQLFKRNPRLQLWWDRHQQSDRDRVVDAMRKSAPCEPEEMAERFLRKAQAVHPVSDFHVQWFYDLAREVCEERNAEIEKKRKMRAIKKQVLESLTEEQREALFFNHSGEE